MNKFSNTLEGNAKKIEQLEHNINIRIGDFELLSDDRHKVKKADINELKEKMAERLKITEFRVFRDDLDMKLNKIMTTHESNKIK